MPEKRPVHMTIFHQKLWGWGPKIWGGGGTGRPAEKVSGRENFWRYFWMPEKWPLSATSGSQPNSRKSPATLLEPEKGSEISLPHMTILNLETIFGLFLWIPPAVFLKSCQGQKNGRSIWQFFTKNCGLGTDFRNTSLYTIAFLY